MCCGSSAVNEDSKLDPTGVFSRTAIAGSFQVTGVPEGNTNIYPPGVVRDFHLLLDTDTLVMTFTAPGDDLDHGTGANINTTNSCNFLYFSSKGIHSLLFSEQDRARGPKHDQQHHLLHHRRD